MQLSCLRCCACVFCCSFSKQSIRSFDLFFCNLFCSQWKVISTALPDDVNDICFTAVHNGHLYVSSRSKLQGCFLVRTADLKNWQRLSVPRGSCTWHGLVSHRGHLFALTEISEREDPSRHPVLFRLNETEDLASDNERQPEGARNQCTWERLSNGRVPTQQPWPAFFGVGNRLLLVGGQRSGRTVATVQEYSLTTGCWLKQSDWPSLPVEQQQPVVMDNVVHLVGGGSYSNREFTGSATVHSMEIETGRCRGTWLSDVIRSTPRVSPGGCRIFNTVAVAGAGGRSVHTDVFVWDARSHEWLRLPSLTVARQQTSLVHFKGSLLAFGGAHAGSHPRWISSVEQFLDRLSSENLRKRFKLTLLFPSFD